VAECGLVDNRLIRIDKRKCKGHSERPLAEVFPKCPVARHFVCPKEKHVGCHR
jgi:hypothetical protein